MEFRKPQDVFPGLIKLIEDSVNRENGTFGTPEATKILFYFSTPIEFVTLVGSLSEDTKYPFIYVNSVRTEHVERTPTGCVWSVPEILIGTLTDSNFSREQRDEINFKPILDPIYLAFRQQLNLSRYIEVVKEGKAQPHYFYGDQSSNGYLSHKFNQPIDVWQIQNMQIRITKQC